MAEIPNRLPEPKRFRKRTKDLSREDYQWLVERRAVALGGRCSKEPTETEGAHENFERIIEDRDFLPANFLSVGATRARAVCRIEMRNSGGWSKWATGFLVAPDILLTNNHVFEQANWAENARLLFCDELDDNGEPKQLELFYLDPDALFITNEYLDFTLVAVKGRPGDKHGYIQLRRDPHLIVKDERVNIIQHPDGRRKEVVVQSNRVETIKQSEILYTADTEPGSSGSPVFSSSWELVALHHAGGEQIDQVWKNNEGIRISAIIRYLENLLRRDSHEGARETLSHVEDRNPWEGIFGSWGRKPEDDKDIERVVYDYQATSAFLDIGFWNIEHFNDTTSQARIRRVADALDNFGLDAIGLVEIAEAPVAALVAELNQRGHGYEYFVYDVRGSQDLAIIYDASTLELEHVPWSDEAKQRLSELVGETGKNAWYRLPLLARMKSKYAREPDNVQFDFLMCVVHAKATTHYDEPGVPEQVRARAAELLAQELSQVMSRLNENEVVVGGDFNARLEEQSFSALAHKLSAVALTSGDAQSGNPDAYTYLGSHGGIIDHIYVTPSAHRHYDPGSISITRIDTDIPDFVDDISDHAPIIARFSYWGDGRPADDLEEPETVVVEVPRSAARVILERR